MTRNLILFLAAAIVVGAMPAWLDGQPGIARGQSPAAIVPVAAYPLTTTEPPALQDNFGDNRIGAFWKLYQEDANNCWVTETNAQLEFEATKEAAEVFAGYVGDGWWLDPIEDFTMKADLYYDLVTYDGGWLSFGVSPTPKKPRDKYVSVGIGCVTRYTNYWREWKDGYEIRWDFVSRFKDRVTLYMSYEAATDTVHVSDSGYGSENAWYSVTGLVRERWGGEPLYVYLGGMAEGAKIESGHAFIDNFAIESGTIVKAVDPGEPGDPGEGEWTGPGERPDIYAPVFMVPSVINRNDPDDPVTVMANLPEDIRPEDIDETQLLVLLPGGLKALKQTAFKWLNCKTLVMASFRRTALMEAITENGEATVQITGQLKDGRDFAGLYTITVE